MELTNLVWNQIKSTIKGKNGTNKLLENWLDPIEFIKSEKTEDLIKITFGVPSQFFFFYVNEHLKDKIAQDCPAAEGAASTSLQAGPSKP